MTIIIPDIHHSATGFFSHGHHGTTTTHNHSHHPHEKSFFPTRAEEARISAATAAAKKLEAQKEEAELGKCRACLNRLKLALPEKFTERVNKNGYETPELRAKNFTDLQEYLRKQIESCVISGKNGAKMPCTGFLDSAGKTEKSSMEIPLSLEWFWNREIHPSRRNFF